MWKQLYTVFTTYEGVYIFYLIPIVYFMIIVCNVIVSKRSLSQRFGAKDITAAAIIVLILLDFIKYLYLLLTKTGELLPPTAFFVKYIIGFFLWIWIFWYSYEGYFTRRVAGEQFRKRRTTLAWICTGSFVLAIVGIIMS